MENFISANTTVPTNSKNQPIKKRRRLKRNSVHVKQVHSKCLIVFGDTMLLRDYIVNDLKGAFNLNLQIISPSVRRSAKTFKDTIFEGSQCNSAIGNTQNAFNSLFGNKQPQVSTTENRQETTQTVNKLLLFEDVDVIFEDESDFYSQLTRLISMTKVPIIITATNQRFITENLLPVLHRSQLNYETMQYKIRRPESKELFALIALIFVFERSVTDFLKFPPSNAHQATESGNSVIKNFE